MTLKTEDVYAQCNERLDNQKDPCHLTYEYDDLVICLASHDA